MCWMLRMRVIKLATPRIRSVYLVILTQAARVRAVCARVAFDHQLVGSQLRPRVMERGQVQQAMAYRVKYRVGKPRSICVDMLGVHMMNRGGHGVYPNSSDVVDLGKKNHSWWYRHLRGQPQRHRGRGNTLLLFESERERPRH